MIDKIKQLLGKAVDPEVWGEEKSKALEAVLGKEHDMVGHSIIPFEIGGGLDLYYYPQATGFAIATKELIERLRDRGFYPYSDLDRPSVA